MLILFFYVIKEFDLLNFEEFLNFGGFLSIMFSGDCVGFDDECDEDIWGDGEIEFNDLLNVCYDVRI